MKIIYRNPSDADLQAITCLFNDSRRGLPFERESTQQEIGSYTLLDPDFDPRGAWVALDGDEVVGYSDAIIDKTRMAFGTKDSQARIEMLQARRGQGIEEGLLNKALGFMKEHGLETAQSWCFEGDVWKRALIESAGFEPVHKYFSMIRRSGTTPPQLPNMPGLRLDHKMARDASTEELSRWLEVTNEAFSELFNYSPWTVERTTNIIDSAEEILSLTFAYLGNELVGVSMIEDSEPYNREHGLHDGWIDIVAVRKRFRKRGIGRILMLDGMHWLLGRGLPVMHLGVDAENRNALGLYTSLGFEVLLENAIYRKKL